MLMIGKIKKALDKGVANKDVWRFAFDAGSWYKAFYIYAQHFLVDPGVGQPYPFPLPWNIEDPIPPISARFAMITALDHALHNIECLEYVLSKRGDNRLTEIKHRLLDDDNFYEEVHGYLRNTNEHDIEYRLEVGKEQGTFQRILATSIGKFYTNPHFTIKIDGITYIGNMSFNEIYARMEKYKGQIIPLLETIFEEYIIKGDPSNDQT